MAILNDNLSRYASLRGGLLEVESAFVGAEPSKVIHGSFVLVGQAAEDVANPSGGIPNIANQLLKIVRVETLGKSCDDGFVYMVLSQVSQCLNDESADTTSRGHVFGSGPFEDDLLAADLDLPVSSICQEHHFGGNLCAESQQVGGIRSRWLNPRTVLVSQSLGNVLRRGGQLAKFGVDAGVVVQPTGQSAYLAPIT